MVLIMNRILTELTVNVTELRKNPGVYFTTDQPVAVLSNNKTAGYMVNAELFEQLIDMISIQQAGKNIIAKFKPSAQRFDEITKQAESILENLSKKDICSYDEHKK